LVNLNRITDVELKYKSAAASADMTDFFRNTAPLECPIEKCQIGLPGKCGTVYANKRISIDSKSPFTISTVSTIVPEGWEEKICYACSTKGQTITQDNWTILQEPDPKYVATAANESAKDANDDDETAAAANSTEAANATDSAGNSTNSTAKEDSNSTSNATSDTAASTTEDPSKSPAPKDESSASPETVDTDSSGFGAD